MKNSPAPQPNPGPPPSAPPHPVWPRLLPRYSAPYLVLAVGLALTAFSTMYVFRTVRARDRMRFNMTIADARKVMEHHMRTYVGLLDGGTGLFAATPNVNLPTFRAYVGQLRLRRHYPGIQGIGFSRYIRPGEKARVEADMRTYFPDFHVWGEDPRAQVHSIVYLEPTDNLNRRAIGYNMFSNPIRRAAMEQARDLGSAVTSGRVRLVQEGREGKQNGFLVYAPVYGTRTTPTTVEERRRTLVGFVYSPFRMEDFIEGVFPSSDHPSIRFDIWDAAERTSDHALYSSQHATDRGFRPEFTEDTIIAVPGRTWSIHFETAPTFRAASGRGVVPLTLAGGLIISCLLFGITLVQARSRAEAEEAAEELRRSRDAAERTAEELRKSEARARRLVESNVIGVVFEHVDGHITEANDALLDMLGYTRADLESGQLLWRDLTPEEYHERDRRAIEELRASGKHAPYEKEYLRKDGQRVPVLVGAAQLEPGGDLAVGYMVDLTDQKRAEAAVRAGQEQLRALYAEAQEARAAAEEANRLKDDFLATVSHELRTPLNAIMGYTQLLKIGRRSPEEITRALDAIERNVKSQAQLIEDLLDVSRIVSGKLRLDVERVDLGAVVQAAIESVAPAAAAKDIHLEAEVDPRVGPIAGDPNRLQQVVWNLLSNAIKFTGQGGCVSVSVARESACVEIAVRDTGSGIEPQFLPHVFDRFRQVDSSTTRRHGGLGLGLSIVRHLVELHGGGVTAESAGAGHGATFTVRLPLSEAWDGADNGEQAPPSTEETRHSANGRQPLDLTGLRVLIVDDEPDARTLVRQILEDFGANVRTACSAQTAMAELADFHPDVLLSDIAMPGEDGYSLIHRVRALGPEQGGDVPAAALTAFARAEDRQRALTAGFQMHLAKPAEPGTIVTTVAILGGRAGHADRADQTHHTDPTGHESATPPARHA